MKPLKWILNRIIVAYIKQILGLNLFFFFLTVIDRSRFGSETNNIKLIYSFDYVILQPISFCDKNSVSNRSRTSALRETVETSVALRGIFSELGESVQKFSTGLCHKIFVMPKKSIYCKDIESFIPNHQGLDYSFTKHCRIWITIN